MDTNEPTNKPAQGLFVRPGGAPGIEKFYAHIDAMGPKFWEQSLDRNTRELERLFALPDPRE
jgi:hypothetical protein